MEGAMNDRRFPANILHDVNLAAVWPASGVDVVTQHPKCRPDTLPVRYLDPCLKPSVGSAELVLSEQSCRRVVAGYAVRPGKRFLEHLDYQPAIIDIRVCTMARIKFPIPGFPAVAARLQ